MPLHFKVQMYLDVLDVPDVPIRYSHHPIHCLFLGNINVDMHMHSNLFTYRLITLHWISNHLIEFFMLLLLLLRYNTYSCSDNNTERNIHY